MEGKIEFARKAVGYRVFAGARTPLRVSAEATLSTEALDREVRVELGRRYWWKIGLFSNPPSQCFMLSVSGMRLPVYAYGSRLSHKQKGMLVKAVSLMAGGVRHERALRRLIAIAVVAGGRYYRNVPKAENGAPIARYGTAFIDASDLVGDEYNSNLKIPYGIGVALHEMAHAVLEPDLAGAWSEDERLGWKTVKGRCLLKLPDGTLTDRYNERPWDAPTEIASRSECDDLAESAVFALAGCGDILGSRANLLSLALRQKPVRARVSVVEADAHMPSVPDRVNVRLVPSLSSSGWTGQAKVEDYSGFVKRNKIASLGATPRAKNAMR